MEAEIEWVSQSELLKAHVRFIEAWPCSMNCDWRCFTGYHEPAMWKRFASGCAHYAYNKQGAKRIRLIAGSPHYKALLRAIAVQYME